MFQKRRRKSRPLRGWAVWRSSAKLITTTACGSLHSLVQCLWSIAVVQCTLTLSTPSTPYREYSVVWSGSKLPDLWVLYWNSLLTGSEGLCFILTFVCNVGYRKEFVPRVGEHAYCVAGTATKMSCLLMGGWTPTGN